MAGSRFWGSRVGWGVAELLFLLRGILFNTFCIFRPALRTPQKDKYLILVRRDGRILALRGNDGGNSKGQILLLLFYYIWRGWGAVEFLFVIYVSAHFLKKLVRRARTKPAAIAYDLRVRCLWPAAVSGVARWGGVGGAELLFLLRGILFNTFCICWPVVRKQQKK